MSDLRKRIDDVEQQLRASFDAQAFPKQSKPQSLEELFAEEAAVRSAVLAEREACAKIAETLRTLKAALPIGQNGEFENEHVTVHGIEIAAAIRARNTKPENLS